MKKLINLFGLGAIVLVIATSYATITSASTNTMIVKKSVTMYMNTEIILTFNNPEEDVKWLVSKNKKVDVIGTKGSKNGRAVVLANNKSGKCTVKAISGNKVYKWSITIKSARNVPRVSLQSVKKTNKKLTISIKYINKSDEWTYYGYYWKVQRIDNGKWIDISEISSYDDVEIGVAANHSHKRKINVANKKNISLFTKGVYRVVTNYCVNNRFKYTYFRIE